MIARLEGVLFESTPTRVILDCGGVGYEVFVPLSTFGALPDEGKTVALRVHTHAREGAIQLFGFATVAEQVAFELLLRASRVGPKLAQTVLSGIEPVDLLEAIRSGNAAPLRAVPGVGTKMADRILVELRDRADELEAVLRASGGEPRATPAPEAAREQALSALVNLGYPKPKAERALEELGAELDAEADVEQWVRGALQRLAR
ncbi:MAG: Holliday junction branch migration protein RuvA [Myxococcota bacterium]